MRRILTSWIIMAAESTILKKNKITLNHDVHIFFDTFWLWLESVGTVINSSLWVNWNFYWVSRTHPTPTNSAAEPFYISSRWKTTVTFSPLWVIRFSFHPYNPLHCNLHEIQTFSLLTGVAIVRPSWPTNLGFYLKDRQIVSGPTSAFRALELFIPTYYQDIVRYIITSQLRTWTTVKKMESLFLPYACFSSFHQSLCKHLLVLLFSCI